MELGIALITVALILFAVNAWMTRRKRALEAALPPAPAVEADLLRRRAPVAEFHVSGVEARVTFDVPLPDEEDQVLNEILVDEAVEVVRDKRHTLPIGDVTEIVALAGRDRVREVGRARLPAPGQLPPPVPIESLNLAHIAKDPFASQFEVDHTLKVETKTRVPSDELGPLLAELRVPDGISRGLRARGQDPDALSGPEFILALLELFGYTVISRDDGAYLASKGGSSTFVATEAHRPGDHPELDETAVRRFVIQFGSSGAQRGLFITDKYGPFMVHDVESKEPRIRFITRERAQRFIDSMALG